MNITLRQARPQDTALVRDILCEAARWASSKEGPFWQEAHLAEIVIAADVEAGIYFIIECDGEAGGTLRFQLEDPEFWPDMSPGQAAYIHRLAVRRKIAGQGVSTAALEWAVRRTASLGRRVLRLDAQAMKMRLRALYERFGFTHHSNRQVGPYFVARYEFPVGRLKGN